MFRIIILFLIITINIVKSQNLVMNPGFEEYWKPEFHPALNYGDTFFAKNWSNVYAGYPSKANHYLEGNVISLPNGKVIKACNIPDNDNGFHPAHSGKAYAGLHLLSLDAKMDHLTGKLAGVLIKDNNYEVSFYIKYAGEKCGVYYTKMEVAFSASGDSTFLKMKKYTNELDLRY